MGILTLAVSWNVLGMAISARMTLLMYSMRPRSWGVCSLCTFWPTRGTGSATVGSHRMRESMRTSLDVAVSLSLPFSAQSALGIRRGTSTNEPLAQASTSVVNMT